MPLGVDLQPGRLLPAERAEGLSAPTALERARTALRPPTHVLATESAGRQSLRPQATTAPTPGMGYLLSRDPEGGVTKLRPCPRSISAAPGQPSPRRHPSPGRARRLPIRPPDPSRPSHPSPTPALRHVVGARLASAIEKSAGLPSQTVDRLREVEELLGIEVLDARYLAGRRPERSTPRSPPGRGLLHRLFSTLPGRPLSKVELESLVVGHGLRLASPNKRKSERRDATPW